MDDIKSIFKKYASNAERQAYFESQFVLMKELKEKNKLLEQELSELKQQLSSNVQKIVLSPEQELIESQLKLIQERSLYEELSLEDVKKLDLLLKNKNLVKSNEPPTFEAQSKKLGLTNAKLLEIANPTNEPV